MGFFRKSQKSNDTINATTTPTAAAKNNLAAVPAGLLPPSATFAHRADKNAPWENYSHGQSLDIANAMANQPTGGCVSVGGPFVVYWGTAAVSPRMPTPPSGMLQINSTNGNTRAVQRVAAPEAIDLEIMQPTAAFSHKGPDGMWTAYPPETAAAIAAARAANPSGGKLTLTGSTFQVRWGSCATSQRMMRAPDTGLIQVNTQNENTRIVRCDTPAAAPAAVPIGLPPAAIPTAIPMGLPVTAAAPAPAKPSLYPSPAMAPAAATPAPTPAPTPIKPLHVSNLANGSILTLAAGSVIDYQGGAFVNAANEGCIGGAGVDERVNNSGGPRLRLARRALGGCHVGCAKTTPAFDHPNTQWIIHAVGPIYTINAAALGFNDKDPRAMPHLLALDHHLVGAYRGALAEAARHQVRSIGFCLLSAGKFRGSRPLRDIVELAVRCLTHALATGGSASGGGRLFDHVTLMGYSAEEQTLLTELGQKVAKEVADGGNGGGEDPQELFYDPFDVQAEADRMVELAGAAAADDAERVRMEADRKEIEQRSAELAHAQMVLKGQTDALQAAQAALTQQSNATAEQKKAAEARLADVQKQEAAARERMKCEEQTLKASVAAASAAAAAQQAKVDAEKASAAAEAKDAADKLKAAEAAKAKADADVKEAAKKAAEAKAAAEQIGTRDCDWVAAPQSVSGGTTVRRLQASAIGSVHSNDLMEFNMAVGQFMRLLGQSGSSCPQITQVDHYESPAVTKRFRDKEAQFKRAGHGERIWVFHGTDEANLEKICSGGFYVAHGSQVKNGAAYGHGVYSAKGPQTPMGYGRGKAVILCLALPGHTGQQGVADSWSPCGDWMIFKTAEQLLPKYVLRFG